MGVLQITKLSWLQPLSEKVLESNYFPFTEYMVLFLNY